MEGLPKDLPIGTKIVHKNGTVCEITGFDKMGHYRTDDKTIPEIKFRIAFKDYINWKVV